MQLGALLPSKPAWYDRDPAPKRQSFSNNGTAPHVSTVQWTYTVPTNRKAWLAHGFVEVYRSAVAAPVGRALVNLNTFDGTTTVSLARLLFLDNTLGASQRLAVSPQYMLEAGLALRGVTQDLSTGGTLDLVVAAHMSEFNLE